MFERHRGLLFSIAYRMLGSVADAEDALQDAFIRWQRASETDVRSPKAFLVTIVSRLCINHLQSARVQRETYVGEWLPEPLVTEPGSDVSRIAELDESVSMAVLLLLERLTAGNGRDQHSLEHHHTDNREGRRADGLVVGVVGPGGRDRAAHR